VKKRTAGDRGNRGRRNDQKLFIRKLIKAGTDRFNKIPGEREKEAI